MLSYVPSGCGSAAQPKKSQSSSTTNPYYNGRSCCKLILTFASRRGTSASVADHVPEHVQSSSSTSTSQDHSTIRTRRRSRKTTTPFGKTVSDVPTSTAAPSGSTQQQQERVTAPTTHGHSNEAQTLTQPPRKRTSPAARKLVRMAATHDQLVAALVNNLQLPQAVAERVVAARSATPFVPPEADKLCRRIERLQQLLGKANTELALRRFPSIVAYSSAKLAFNYSQWQLFFGLSDMSQQLQAAREQALQHKLAERPQLLAAHVEELVAHYYEIAHMLGCQDYHGFAYKALDLGYLSPDRLQDKLLRLLAFINAAVEQQLDAQSTWQQHLQQTQHHGNTPAQPPTASPAPAAATASKQTAQNVPRLFSLSDLQSAARRDPTWLKASSETLKQRLTGIQQALGVSMYDVAQMFLRNPSLLKKKPATLAAKAAALRGLPGMQPQQAAAAIAALPSLLNLDPGKLRDRWQRLQQGADTHPSWRTALDNMPPSSLACLLIRGEARYQRMQQILDLGLQDKVTLLTLFNISDRDFEAKLAKLTKPKPVPAAET